MDNFDKFNRHLQDLYGDIYSQPEDVGHRTWADQAIKTMTPDDIENVLDVGCGTGFCQDSFDESIHYEGITKSMKDLETAKYKNRNVFIGDMTDLYYEDESFDMVLARHVLEHSPFPVITLMEWYRVSKKYLLLVAPAPDYWEWGAKNHYSMACEQQLWWWFRRVGWKILRYSKMSTVDDIFTITYADNQRRMEANEKLVYWQGMKDVEYRYLCVKTKPNKE
jgi:ubiquinone/menaquinone biosynthesis C-methylase UbiE